MQKELVAPHYILHAFKKNKKKSNASATKINMLLNHKRINMDASSIW
jgi:cbb3-type cytochrome oxidase subunit 3